MIAYEFKAPEDIPAWASDRNMVFLGGSIEMGAAENWQTRITEFLSDYEVTILNPRRDDWDSTWVQSFHNEKFREQVEWELEMQEIADTIIYYFDPNTKSPITLLELGLFGKPSNVDQQVIVCCPKEFWRKGNVDIVCARYGILLVESFDELITALTIHCRFLKDES